MVESSALPVNFNPIPAQGPQFHLRWADEAPILAGMPLRGSLLTRPTAQPALVSLTKLPQGKASPLTLPCTEFC